MFKWILNLLFGSVDNKIYRLEHRLSKIESEYKKNRGHVKVYQKDETSHYRIISQKLNNLEIKFIELQEKLRNSELVSRNMNQIKKEYSDLQNHIGNTQNILLSNIAEVKRDVRILKNSYEVSDEIIFKNRNQEEIAVIGKDSLRLGKFNITAEGNVIKIIHGGLNLMEIGKDVPMSLYKYNKGETDFDSYVNISSLYPEGNELRISNTTKEKSII